MILHRDHPREPLRGEGRCVQYARKGQGKPEKAGRCHCVAGHMWMGGQSQRAVLPRAAASPMIEIGFRINSRNRDNAPTFSDCG